MFGLFKKPDPAQRLWPESDGMKADLRRGELACLRHQRSSGRQIADSTVRWTCECGAYQDYLDAPPPGLPGEKPSGAYLEQKLRGTQGTSGPWRSQVNDQPMPPIQQHTPGTPGSSYGVSEVSSAAQARAALADTVERAGYLMGALAQARIDLDEIVAQINTVSHDAQSLTEVTGCYQQARDQLDEVTHLLFRAKQLTKTYGLRLLT